MVLLIRVSLLLIYHLTWWILSLVIWRVDGMYRDHGGWVNINKTIFTWCLSLNNATFVRYWIYMFYSIIIIHYIAKFKAVNQKCWYIYAIIGKSVCIVFWTDFHNHYFSKGICHLRKYLFSFTEDLSHTLVFTLYVVDTDLTFTLCKM